MSKTWQTEFGPRRVRQEPPTLDEAVAAAQGLTDDQKQQVEIAASLMGITPDDAVRKAVAKAHVPASRPRITVSAKGRGGIERAVVVERKTVRRPAGATVSRPGASGIKRYGY